MALFEEQSVVALLIVQAGEPIGTGDALDSSLVVLLAARLHFGLRTFGPSNAAFVSRVVASTTC